MGTFVIRAGSVNLNSGVAPWTDNNGVTTNLVLNTWGSDAGGPANNFDNISNSPSIGLGITNLRFNGDSAAIYVDGVPTSFVSLPSGFTPTSALATARVANLVGGGTNNFYLQFDKFTESTAKTSVGSSHHIITFNYPSSIPSILNLFNNGFGLRYDSSGTSSCVAQVNVLEITGNYSIISNTWTINGNTPPNPPASVNYGDTITLASSGSSPLDFTHLNSISVQYVDNSGTFQIISISTIYPSGITSNLLTWTSSLYTFLLPKLTNPNPNFPIGIIGVGDGTQFSGSVILGLLTILIINGSGVYVIIKDKTADTIYTNSLVNNTTSNVKIPDPFIKTGFLP